MRKVYKEKKAVYHFNLFEKRKRTTEMPLRIGAELHNYKASANINIPFVLRFAGYSTAAQTENKNPYGIQHIYDFRIGNFFRTGFDSYKGEFAILLPLLKLWFQCDYLSNNFRQFKRFCFFLFLLKIKWNEITFRVGLLGFRFSFRLGSESKD